MLRGSEEEVHKKAAGLPKEIVVGSHWTKTDIERRYKEWNRLNSIHNYKLVEQGEQVQFPL